jgi:integrase
MQAAANEVSVAKLGQRLATTLQPSGADSIVWDDEVRGFGLRVRASGQRRWIYQYRPAGLAGTKRLVIGDAGVMKAEEARTIAKGYALARARGEDPAAARDALKADLTVAQLIERWIEAGCPRARPGRSGGAFLKSGTADTYRSGLRHHVVPLVGKLKLAKLTRADVERMQRRIACGETAIGTAMSGRPRGRVRVTGGETIAGRVTAYFAAVLSWAEREGMIAASPATGVRVIPVRRKDRYLSVEEIERLGDALAAAEAEGMSSTFISAVRLIALTGCRKSEALRLRWEDVDLQAGCLRLPDSKTGAKVIPLTTAAKAFLASLPREVDEAGRPTSWVFPSGRGNGPIVGIGRAFDRICALAGFGDDVTLHVLRHSFASAAVAAGGSLFLVGKVLGHSNTTTTERYSHVALDPVHAVAELGGQRIAMALAAGEARRRGTPSGEVIEISNMPREGVR